MFFKFNGVLPPVSTIKLEAVILRRDGQPENQRISFSKILEIVLSPRTSQHCLQSFHLKIHSFCNFFIQCVDPRFKPGLGT